MTAKVVADSAPPYTLAFAIAGLPKMSNQLLRGHWRVKHAHALAWKAHVAKAVFLNGGPPLTPLKRARLTMTRLSSVEPDHDGLVSGFKHVIDGLVECGVLAGDKREHIGVPEYVWAKGTKNSGRITVRVEEVRE